MDIAVYDTWVHRPDGAQMHFDILVPTSTAPQRVYAYGDAYLATRNLPGVTLSTNRCAFCHIEEPTPEVLASIGRQGYHIIELAGCEVAA